MAVLITLTALNACSASPTNTQKSIDTRACNAISYGNKDVDVQRMDGIYEICMEKKKESRIRKHKDENKLAIVDFILSIFISEDN
jgi:hypothetical protein